MTNDNAESRRMIEQCYKRHKTSVNPIIDWSDSEVWQFIHGNSIPYCDLYHEGFHRLGCIGCPMAMTKGREREFARWPKYKDAYLRAFERMIQERKRKGYSWLKSDIEPSVKDVFNWWMEYDVLPGQYNMFDEEVDDADNI